VLIAGGGVAGLETLLALRALAGDRVDIAVLSPDPWFVNRSMSVAQPFKAKRSRGLAMQGVTAELGVVWHRGTVGRVEPERHCVLTKAGQELRYDWLVLAIGAHSAREWNAPGVLTYHGGEDSPAYRLLLRRLCDGTYRRAAFVKPEGTSRTLLLYDLALMTAAYCGEYGCGDLELTLITPEPEPLGVFGPAASAAVSRLMHERGITLCAGSSGTPRRTGGLDVSPGGRHLRADRVITEPRLVGPRLRGLRCGADGFIGTDPYGRVDGAEDVFAAGDVTAFPVKQGGLAAQQADAVAETIAASVGADVTPRPFRPVLRGVLLTGGSPHYLRADMQAARSEATAVSDQALWWPPGKLAARYLAPYLSRQGGRAFDVMPQDGPAARVASTAELTDLPLTP
jgi:sulfide:quinone oxidoreductase